jgi:hypothetical protein
MDYKLSLKLSNIGFAPLTLHDFQHTHGLLPAYMDIQSLASVYVMARNWQVPNPPAPSNQRPLQGGQAPPLPNLVALGQANYAADPSLSNRLR